MHNNQVHKFFQNWEFSIIHILIIRANVDPKDESESCFASAKDKIIYYILNEDICFWKWSGSQFLLDFLFPLLLIILSEKNLGKAIFVKKSYWKMYTSSVIAEKYEQKCNAYMCPSFKQKEE